MKTIQGFNLYHASTKKERAYYDKCAGSFFFVHPNDYTRVNVHTKKMECTDEAERLANNPKRLLRNLGDLAVQETETAPYDFDTQTDHIEDMRGMVVEN